MRLKEIEARVVRLEAARKASRFDGMTYEGIEALAQQKLERLIAHYGSFAAVVAAMGNDPFLELAPKCHCIHISQLLQAYFCFMTYNHRTLSSRLKVQQRQAACTLHPARPG